MTISESELLTMPLPEPWFSISDAVVRAQTVADYAAIYDSIAKNGIWELDEFNRPIPREPRSEAAKWAQGYVMRVMQYEFDGPEHGREDEEGPLDGVSVPSEGTWRHGWPEEDPQFAETRTAANAERSDSRSAQSKRSDSQLLVIAALIAMLGKSRDSRGLATEIARQVSNLDGMVSIDGDTVRAILKSIDDAFERRSR